MDWDPSNFEDRLANLKRSWVTSERVGQPVSIADKVWEELSLELEFSGKPLAELENIGWNVKQWLLTKNPHYIDAAFLGCRQVGIDAPPTLLGQMKDVAAIRFAGLAGLGTGKSIRDDAILTHALHMVCCLHLGGQISVGLAASKVAQYLYDQDSQKTYKASTLERQYGKVFRKGNSPLEDSIRSALNRAPPEARREWARLACELPEADEDLMGSRR